MQSTTEIDEAEKSNFRPKPAMGLTGWFILLSSIAIYYFAYYVPGVNAYSKYKIDVADANASKNWTGLSGTVTSSAVKQVDNVLPSRYSRNYHFQPAITYEYTVKNKTYQQNHVSFPDPSFEDERKAQEFIAQYQPGDSVKVYYDPKDPQRSCLNNGITTALKKTFFWRADASHNE
jgi:hypothetical protein